MQSIIGHQFWVIPEGYIPGASHGPAPDMTSHEALCVLNADTRDAHLQVTIFYENREPQGPYRLEAPARRTRHFRFNDLRDPEPIPLGTPFSSTIESDVPVVIQHTRLDTRQAESSLMTTMAFPVVAQSATQ
jgi:hypothetical protein